MSHSARQYCFISADVPPVLAVFGIDYVRAQRVYEHLGSTFIVMDPAERRREGFVSHAVFWFGFLSSAELCRGPYTAQWSGLKALPLALLKISFSSKTSTHMS